VKAGRRDKTKICGSRTAPLLPFFFFLKKKLFQKECVAVEKVHFPIYFILVIVIVISVIFLVFLHFCKQKLTTIRKKNKKFMFLFFFFVNKNLN
jgi:hypothetical protein